MIYLICALLSGIVLSVMISINGNLTAQYGIFPAAAIIHLVGSCAALLLCAVKREKGSLWTHGPKWIYLGGAIGVLTTVFQNFAFGRISLTSIVALGLFGQTCMSLLVDRFGLLGMRKQRAQSTAWISIVFALVGIFVMLDNTVTTAAFAVCAAFGSGITVVLSRTVNARLAAQTGALRGSLVNHLVGLPITVVLAAVALRGAPLSGLTNPTASPWAYLGGVLGVAVVLLCNLAVPKISAFRMTLLGFVGQVFTGVLLDVLSGGGYTKSSFLGGLLIAAGVAVNLLLERVAVKREQKRREYYARIKRVETAYRDSILKKHPLSE